MNQIFGGMTITRVKTSGAGATVLANDAYSYQAVPVSKGMSFNEARLKSFTVVAIEATDDFRCTTSESKQSFGSDFVIQCEDVGLTLNIEAGSALILVSGTNHSSGLPTSFCLKNREQVKKVVKPWGYEIWLNNEHPTYAFKEIFIKAGNKTSLQYHRIKRETNFLVNGQAALHYLKKPVAELDRVISSDVTTTSLNSFSSIDVFPLTLHRIESTTDVLLYETSTPHLDDVVRVQDDSSRGSGRIQSEHGSK